MIEWLIFWGVCVIGSWQWWLIDILMCIWLTADNDKWLMYWWYWCVCDRQLTKMSDWCIDVCVCDWQLTMMSADRYLAVCHPVWSINYRTPEVAKVVCLCVWALSGLAMTPIIVFADLRPIPGRPPSCSVDFPPIGSVPPENAFILYALVVGFAFPVALSTVFYSLVCHSVDR